MYGVKAVHTLHSKLSDLEKLRKNFSLRFCSKTDGSAKLKKHPDFINYFNISSTEQFHQKSRTWKI